MASSPDTDIGAAPSPRRVASSAEARTLLDFLLAEGRVGLIIGPRGSGKTKLLEDAASAFGGAVFKVANPLGAPLNLTRIMVQVDANDDGADDAAQLRAHLASHARPDLPALLTIDDAHTLDTVALAALAGFISQSDDGPGVRLILAGDPAFDLRLVSPGLEALHDPVTVIKFSLQGSAGEVPVEQQERWSPPPDLLPAVPPPPPPLTAPLVRPVSETDAPIPIPVLNHPPPPRDGGEPDKPAPAISLSVPDTVPPAAVKPLSTGRSRSIILVLVAVAVLGVVAVVSLLDRRRMPASTGVPAIPERGLARSDEPAALTVPQGGPAALPSSEPAPASAPASASAPAPAAEADAGPSPAPSVAPQAMPTSPSPSFDFTSPRPLSRSEAELRTEFQAFLNRTGRSALTRDPARLEALFQDYLRWRSGTQRDGQFYEPR